MIPDRPDQLSRRLVLGVAGAAVAAPLLEERLARAAPSPAAEQGTDRPGAPPEDAGLLPLEARLHGVVGDGRVDDTGAVQAFLDLCARRGGRIAHFGSLVVRITGPLLSRGVGIVFDPAAYGAAGDAGFVVEGEGFTALTVVGSVSDFCVTLRGATGIDITDSGRIDRDRRPRLNGIAFGTETEPFMMATVRSVRVLNLAGFGIRHWQCWDSTFLSVSVERCGREGAYAFEVAGNAQQTCNETVWVRVHVEQAVGGAIRVDSGTLSCSFGKIHSERALAQSSIPTWYLGGSCVYDAVRLTAAHPPAATLSIVSNQGEFRNLRAEGGIVATVNASGGTVTFHNPGAVLRPATDQNGTINIIGGVVAILAMGGGWNLLGSQVARLEVGFMSPGIFSTLTGCLVGELVPQPGVDQGELVLAATRVTSATLSGAGRLRAIHLRDGSQIAGPDGTLVCGEQMVRIDASSRVNGNLLLRRASLRLAGTVTGDLTVQGAVHDARADDTASVAGTVTGWGRPDVPASPGSWSTNIGVDSGAQPRGVRQQAVAGWRFAAGGWHPVRIDLGDR